MKIPPEPCGPGGIGGAGVGLGSWLGFPVAISLNDDPVGLVPEPVDGGRPEDLIGEHGAPLIEVEVGS